MLPMGSIFFLFIVALFFMWFTQFNINKDRNKIKYEQLPFFLCQRMLPFSVCCLLCYSANWLHITLIVHEFLGLQYTHYQHLIVMLDVDKWMYGIATEFKKTGTLSKCIQNIIQSEELIKQQCFVKACNTPII